MKDLTTWETVDLPAEVSPVGLGLPEGLSFDEWTECGLRISRVAEGAMWWLGDWWRYGDQLYGERAAKALDSAMPYSFQTLMNAGWVAGRIETSRRREVLTFSHHGEVAALDPADQDRLLDAAETHGWSRDALRQAVREHKALLRGDTGSGEARTRIADRLNGSGMADPDTVDNEADTILDHVGPEATETEIDQAVDECIESKRLPVAKPDLGAGVSHPARYSDPLFDHFREMLQGYRKVLDPFAGTGRIHELRPQWETTGVEIEPEWADLSPFTIIGNALELPFAVGLFDAVCTSPTYGNRLADHHNAVDPHLRRSYTHDLGRQLHGDNSGSMQWGDEYRAFHERAWAEAARVLRPRGRLVLNIKDHIRAGAWQDVTAWHLRTLIALGFTVSYVRAVQTSSLRQGTNSDVRVGAEQVVGLDAP